jgi:hypothetical protein
VKDFVTSASVKPEVLGPDPEVIELIKTILRQHEKIVMSNIQLLERLGSPMVYFPNQPAAEK